MTYRGRCLPAGLASYHVHGPRRAERILDVQSSAAYGQSCRSEEHCLEKPDMFKKRHFVVHILLEHERKRLVEGS